MLLKMNLLWIYVVAVFLITRSSSSEGAWVWDSDWAWDSGWAWEWDSGCKVLSPTASVSLDSATNRPCCMAASERHNRAILLGGENDTRIERVFRFEFEALNSKESASVGLSNTFMLGQDNSFAGAMYGQHLSNGNELLISGFGQPIANGDVVTMKVKRVRTAYGKRVKVFFGHNERGLGQAYDICENDLPFSSPAISLKSPGRVVVTDITGTKDFTKLETRDYPDVSGSWRMYSSSVDLGRVKIKLISLRLARETEKLQGNLQVVNTIPLIGLQMPDDPNRWRVNFLPSSLMVGDAGAMETEYLLKSSLASNDTVLVHDPLKDTLGLYHGYVKHSSWVRSRYVGNPFGVWQRRNPKKLQAMLSRTREVGLNVTRCIG